MLDYSLPLKDWKNDGSIAPDVGLRRLADICEGLCRSWEPSTCVHRSSVRSAKANSHDAFPPDVLALELRDDTTGSIEVEVQVDTVPPTRGMWLGWARWQHFPWPDARSPTLELRIQCNCSMLTSYVPVEGFPDITLRVLHCVAMALGTPLVLEDVLREAKNSAELSASRRTQYRGLIEHLETMGICVESSQS